MKSRKQSKSFTKWLSGLRYSTHERHSNRRRFFQPALEPLEVRRLLAVDFGDAPDTAVGTRQGDYITLAADNGPSHTIVAGLKMGANVDGDDGMLQNASANADDTDQSLPDDEDGLSFPQGDLSLTVGTQPAVNVFVTNVTGSDATLSGWIDYNNDGAFDNGSERAQITVADGTANEIVTLTFPTVLSGFTGETYARFRVSTDAAANNSTGAASDGEVEDYRATILLSGSGQVDAGTITKIGSGSQGGPTLANGDHFGRSVASIGDLDGDGVTDIVVGAAEDDTGGESSGAVYVVFLNIDGTSKNTVKIADELNGGPDLQSYVFFGRSVASVGDLNADGVNDIVAGAMRDPTGGGGNGAAYVLFLNADGTVKSSTKIASETNGAPIIPKHGNFGRSIASIGDLDGDGVGDIAVGAHHDRNGAPTVDRGAVYVLFLNADGTVKNSVKLNSGANGTPEIDSYANFGSSIAAMGDHDNDGVNDLAVGDWNDGTGGVTRGAVHLLYMNADGTVKNSSKIDSSTLGGPVLNDFDRFGYSVMSPGDLDGDAVSDLVVGAAGDSSGGAIHVILLNADGTPKNVQRFASDILGLGLPNSDEFGSSLASIGDLNGDGLPELVVGNDFDDTGGDARGAVYVMSLAPQADTLVAKSPDGVLTVTDADGGDSNDELTITHSGGHYTISDAGGLIIDATAVGGGFGDSVTFSDAGVNGISFQTLDGDDRVTVGSVLPDLSGGFHMDAAGGNDTANIAGSVNVIGSGTIDVTADHVYVNAPLSGEADMLLSATGSSGRDVRVNADITKSGGADATLTLRANRDVLLVSEANITASVNRLNIVLNSHRSTGSAAGGVAVAAGSEITTNGGDITIGGGTDPATMYTSYLDSSHGLGNRGALLAGSLRSGAGDISVRSSWGGVGIAAPVETTSGNVTIRSVNSPTSYGHRVLLYNDGIIRTDTGDIDILGSASPGHGLGIGVSVSKASNDILSNSGSITITGRGTGGGNGAFVGIDLTKGSTIGGPTATGDIRLVTDTYIGDSVNIQSTGSLTVAPLKSETSIGIGRGAGELNLSDTELSMFADGFSSITIGNQSNGTGNIDIDTATFHDPVTIVGGTIHDSDGTDINMAGGDTATLTGNVSPGQSPGVLNVAGDVDLADGSTLTIEIDGDAGPGIAGGHDQLSALGSVDIAGAVNLAFAGARTLSGGESFTIVSRVGGTGMFDGMPEGGTVADFLGSGLDATISYVGGDGDDVVISVDPSGPGISVVGDVLMVVGTEDRDVIYVHRYGSDLLIRARFANGSWLTNRVPQAEVNSITVDLGDGNDLFYASSGVTTDVNVNATRGNNQIFTGSGDDTILGGQGNEFIFAGNGDDRIDAGDGNNRVFGHAGNDTLIAGGGNDFLDGGDNDDVLIGGDGRDLLFGRRGNDLLAGGDGKDTLLGGRGNDVVVGGDGGDYLFGDDGEDLLIAGATTYDANDIALRAILNEWSSGSDQAVRRDNLRTGGGDYLQGIALVAGATVLDDNDRDLLFGGRDEDWFWADLGEDLLVGFRGFEDALETL